MVSKFAAFIILALAVAACAPPAEIRFGPDGKPLPKVYRIADASQVQFRMLDSVNALRRAAGVGPVRLDNRLTAAAATHSLDMSVQNRPWHFGSDGSSPLDRVARSGYAGALLGENISETYETELETLAAWMERADTRMVILDPRASAMGFAWQQDRNGKIWWALVMGGPEAMIRQGVQG